MAPTDDKEDKKHQREEDAAEPVAKMAKTDESKTIDLRKAENPDWKEWKFDDGTVEKIVDITEEPRHNLDFTNQYGRAFTIKFPAKDTTLAHSHFVDTIIILLMKGGIRFINHVMGDDPKEGCMCFKQLGFAPFTFHPCVHKITNLSEEEMFCINVEVLKSTPIKKEKALDAPHHSVEMTKDNCRVYKLKLEKGESVTVSYDFFYTRVVLEAGKIEMSYKTSSGGSIKWEETTTMGDIGWNEPCADLSIKNTGDSVYEAYICEWR
uniref:Uncharacterized protein n=1 Tax=Trieres chinensis TaxID=1514140 RepID=A0A7S1Z014_TRICV